MFHVVQMDSESSVAISRRKGCVRWISSVGREQDIIEWENPGQDWMGLCSFIPSDMR